MNTNLKPYNKEEIAKTIKIFNLALILNFFIMLTTIVVLALTIKNSFPNIPVIELLSGVFLLEFVILFYLNSLIGKEISLEGKRKINLLAKNNSLIKDYLQEVEKQRRKLIYLDVLRINQLKVIKNKP